MRRSRGADPRRLRVYPGVRRRAVLPGRQSHRALRRDVRDPAHRDRQFAPSGPHSKDRVMKSKVAVLRTTPDTVVRDVGRLMELADARAELSPDKRTLLKVNISWHVYYPGCSSSPWQLEGVIQSLLESGFSADRILAAQ